MVDDNPDKQLDKQFAWILCILIFGNVIFLLFLLFIKLTEYWIETWPATETSLPQSENFIFPGWELPSIRMQLCELCRALPQWGSTTPRIRHHGNFLNLKRSGEHGCWCCSTVVEQLATSIQDHDSPPSNSHLTHLKIPHLLLWFAEQTWTESGYLDHLRQIDYFEYILRPRSRACETDPASEASFCLIRSWLENCNLHHWCYQGAGVRLPTRLIDVSTDQPYLLTTSGIQGPYIALSHCWGEKQPITTATGTINARVNGIPLATLPKMFQDAVLITKRLNIKYLWIDSLCIIQDSIEDWAREAVRMGDIYRYAFLTLFALDSKDCHEGILVERSPGNPSDVGNLHDYERSVRVLLKPESRQAKKDVLKASPLCKRGWVLQERLLSPRILYYSTEEFFWECLASTARESEMGFEAYRPATYVHQRYDCADVKNRLIQAPGPNPSLPLSPPLDWRIIAVEYSRCQLTKQTDKLPAVSGLASIFSVNTGYTYLAGLWKEDFRDGLLWYVESTNCIKSRPSDLAYRGPSWSWISLDCPILYATTQDGSHPRAGRIEDIELIDWNVQLLDEHTFGQIASASVTVEAIFKDFWYQYCTHSKRHFIYDLNGVKLESLFLDRAEDDLSAKKACAGLWVTQRQFQVGDSDVPNPPCFTWSYFLVVVPDITSENSWRRIGLSRSFRGDKIFKGCSKVQLNLV